MTFPAGQLPSNPTDHGTVVTDIRAIEDKVGYDPGNDVESYLAGLWNAPKGVSGGTTMAQDTLYLRRYRFPVGTSFTQLSIFIRATGATATAAFRFAIYDDDGTGCYPAGVLLDSLSTADLTTTGAKASPTFTAVPVGGLVWMGGVIQVAAPGSNTVSGLSAGGDGMAASAISNENAWQAYVQTSVTSTLPSTFTASRAVSNVSPRIWYK